MRVADSMQACSVLLQIVLTYINVVVRHKVAVGKQVEHDGNDRGAGRMHIQRAMKTVIGHGYNIEV